MNAQVKTAQHTPGPWTKETTRVDDTAPIAFLHLDWAVRQGRTVIAHIPMISTKLLESEQNARLIAAAPELAEALRYVLDPNVSRQMLEARARAALAKAGL